MAPTAIIDSGQISLISSRRGTFLTLPVIIPAQPQKNCGEVAIMMSGLS